MSPPAPTKQVPRLPGSLLLGHLAEVRSDWLGLLRRVADECGDAGELRFAMRRVVVINEPAWARQILMDDADAFDKGPTLRNLAGRFLGDGLISARAQDHRRLRALVTPAFAPRRIEGYVGHMYDEAQRTSDQLQHGDTLDLYELMSDLTIRTIGRALFSTDLLAHHAEIRRSLNAMMAWITNRVRRPWSPPLAVPTPLNRRALAAVRALEITFGALIAARRRSAETHNDILSALLTAQDRGLTDKELYDQLITLCFAGFETTASTLAWAFALLAEHPSVEAMVSAEAQQDTLSTPNQPSAIRRVLSETLRLYPPAHTLGRKALRDITVGPWLFRKGGLVVISPWLMHRRAQQFTDPERFDPARWRHDREVTLPRCAYLPFGAGPRACLGGQFATMQMHIVLKTLLRDWRFVPVTAGLPTPIIQVTLRPNHLPVRVERRVRQP